MKSKTYFSPAKINLYLKVLGKRSDGYHELSTLMQAIDLGDTLHFEWGSGQGLTTSDPALPTSNSNLVNKAIDLFTRKTGIREPVRVHIDKKIPMEAGLGGGSSNAATTLWALNEKAGRPASVHDLVRWSAEIGSDISFFFSEGIALCEGRGEQITSIAPRSSSPIWIVKPHVGLSTATVFQQFSFEPSEQKGEFFNDLERPAFLLRPELYFLKKILMNTAFKIVTMSGSGTALVCMDKKGELPALPNVSIYSAQFLNRSPDSWYQ